MVPPSWFVLAIVWHAGVQVDAANGQNDAIPGHNSTASLADCGVPLSQSDADVSCISPSCIACFDCRRSTLAVSRSLLPSIW